MNSVGGNLAAENTIRLISEMIFYCRSEEIRLRLTDCRRGRYDTVARCLLFIRVVSRSVCVCLSPEMTFYAHLIESAAAVAVPLWKLCH